VSGSFRAERDGDVVCFTIDRPEAKNALDLATIVGLTQAIRTTPMRVAILTGAGDTFVSGGDLRELRGRDSAADAEYLTDVGFELTTAIADAPFPVIAALNGPAIGGGAELALACDLRVATAAPRIELKQVHMGVTTSWGTAARLRELVGNSVATRLLFGLRLSSAKDLFDAGLVDVAADDPRAAALEMAHEIEKAPASAIAAMKRLVRAPSGSDLRALERRLFVETWSSSEHRAAVEAWFRRVK
jgi:enoyl-CoA hydratase